MTMVPLEVIEYLGAASASGIIGNASYDAVNRLGAWMRDVAGWDGSREVDIDLSDAELTFLRELLRTAQQEWQPSIGPTATQHINVGRDMNAPAINRIDTR